MDSSCFLTGKFLLHLAYRRVEFYRPLSRIAINKANGHFVITEKAPSTKVKIYDETGNFVRSFVDKALQHLRGVAVDDKGFIVVLECKVNFVFRCLGG